MSTAPSPVGGGGKVRLARELARAHVRREEPGARALHMHKPTFLAAGKHGLQPSNLGDPAAGARISAEGE